MSRDHVQGFLQEQRSTLCMKRTKAKRSNFEPVFSLKQQYNQYLTIICLPSFLFAVISCDLCPLFKLCATIFIKNCHIINGISSPKSTEFRIQSKEYHHIITKTHTRTQTSDVAVILSKNTLKI